MQVWGFPIEASLQQYLAASCPWSQMPQELAAHRRLAQLFTWPCVLSSCQAGIFLTSSGAHFSSISLPLTRDSRIPRDSFPRLPSSQVGCHSTYLGLYCCKQYHTLSALSVTQAAAAALSQGMHCPILCPVL